MDNLAYTYKTNKPNQLLRVDDTGPETPMPKTPKTNREAITYTIVLSN